MRDGPTAFLSHHSYTWIVPITWMTLQTTGERQWLTNVSGTAHPAWRGAGVLLQVRVPGGRVPVGGV